MPMGKELLIVLLAVSLCTSRAADFRQKAATKVFDVGGADETCLSPLFSKNKDKCGSFTLSEDYLQDSLDTLCRPGHTNKFGKATAIPFLSGCELARACNVLSDSPAAPTCSKFQVLATLCSDMPPLGPCSKHRRMCSMGSAVEACTEEPFPGFPSLHTLQALQAVQSLCAYGGEGSERVPRSEAMQVACDSCSYRGRNTLSREMAERCPRVIHSLATICSLQPKNGTGVGGFDRLCDPWRSFCSRNEGVFPSICGGAAQA